LGNCVGFHVYEIYLGFSWIENYVYKNSEFVSFVFVTSHRNSMGFSGQIYLLHHWWTDPNRRQHGSSSRQVFWCMILSFNSFLLIVFFPYV